MNGHGKSKINSPSTTLKTLVYCPYAKISNKCHVVLSLFLKLTLKHVPYHNLRKKRENSTQNFLLILHSCTKTALVF